MARFGEINAQYFDDAGDPLGSGKLYFYETGTTTLKDTYSDINQTIANTNPVILSAAGRQPNIFFSGTAKAILTDKNDVQILVRDPVGATASIFGDGWVATKIYSTDAVVLGSDGQYYRSLVAGNQNNDPTSTSGYWTLLYSVQWNSGITYQEGAVVTYNGEQYQSLQNSNLNNNPSSATTYWVLLSFAWLSTRTYDLNENAVGTDGILYTSLQNSNTGNIPASSPSYWVGTSAAAAASATAAATSATNAATSETNAANSATASATSATNSANSATAAATSETNAANSATASATSATNSATSATASANSATAAAASATDAANTYDEFDDRYLGEKSSDPTTDNDGDPLITGALYFNSVSTTMRVYTGSAWQDTAAIATTITLSQVTDVTATATEVNVLDGIPATLTSTELGYVDGVTSPIQTQINSVSGILSATAAEAITANDVVAMNSSGEIEKVQIKTPQYSDYLALYQGDLTPEVYSTQDTVSGGAHSFNDSAIAYIKTLDAFLEVGLYNDGVTYYVEGRFITKNESGVWEKGSEFVIFTRTSTLNRHVQLRYVETSEICLVVYENGDIDLQTIDVSSITTSPTIGAVQRISSSTGESFGFYDIGKDATNTYDQFVIEYQDGSAEHSRLVQVTSAGVVSFGSEISWGTDRNQMTSKMCGVFYDPTNDWIVWIYVDDNNSDRCTLQYVTTRTGNTRSSKQVIDTQTNIDDCTAGRTTDSDRWMIGYTQGQLKVAMVTWNATSSLYDVTTVANITSITGQQVDFVDGTTNISYSPRDEKMIVLGKDAGSNAMCLTILEDIATGVWTSSNVAQSLAGDETTGTQSPGSFSHAGQQYYDKKFSYFSWANGQAKNISMLRQAGTNFDSFVGIADTSASAAASVDYRVRFNVQDNFTGLTPAAVYYCDVNGNVTNVAADAIVDDGARVGIAISSTELLIE